jgi:hypothetical protein
VARLNAAGRPGGPGEEQGFDRPIIGNHAGRRTRYPEEQASRSRPVEQGFDRQMQMLHLRHQAEEVVGRDLIAHGQIGGLLQRAEEAEG